MTVMKDEDLLCIAREDQERLREWGWIPEDLTDDELLAEARAEQRFLEGADTIEAHITLARSRLGFRVANVRAA